jgi:hypothetical protein
LLRFSGGAARLLQTRARRGDVAVDLSAPAPRAGVDSPF